MKKQLTPSASKISSDLEPVPLELIQSRILVLRGMRVILDADLAALYDVPTKRLNEQVKRNDRRFPEDFCFQLSAEETANLISQIAISSSSGGSRSQNAILKTGPALRSHFATSKPGRGGRRYLPFAFTEHGAIQAANVLNSEAATRMSVAVVRAFVRLRQLVVNHKAIPTARLRSAPRQLFAARSKQREMETSGLLRVSASARAELDKRVGEHDHHLAALVEAIRLLTTPDQPPKRRRIGFHPD